MSLRRWVCPICTRALSATIVDHQDAVDIDGFIRADGQSACSLFDQPDLCSPPTLFAMPPDLDMAPIKELEDARQ